MTEFKVGDEVQLIFEFTYNGKTYGNVNRDIYAAGNRGVVTSIHDDGFPMIDWKGGVGSLITDASCIESIHRPVTDEEVAELFHLQPDQPEIDWRKLFKEYVEAIEKHEGVDFLLKIEVDWTEAEWEAVHEL